MNGSEGSIGTLGSRLIDGLPYFALHSKRRQTVIFACNKRKVVMLYIYVGIIS